MSDIITKKVTSCGIIPVFVNDKGENEFLCVQANHGAIAFPKGHVEAGETYLETAQRELLEETALICSRVDIEHMISEHYTIIRPEKIIEKTVHYFIGYVDNQSVKIQPEEIQNYFWLNAEETFKKINYNDSKQVFKDALTILNKK